MDMVNEYKGSFASILSDYKKNCSGNDTSFAEWKKTRQEIESQLAKELDGIQNPDFRAQVKAMAKHSNFERIEAGCDFDKFCYFIDRLNTEKYSPKIIKYNKNYCHGIINAIAYEYVRILNYIETDAERLARINDKEFNEAKNKAINLWNEMCSNRLKQIILDEYNAVIQEVESRV